jgi:hypothetical protein
MKLKKLGPVGLKEFSVISFRFLVKKFGAMSDYTPLTSVLSGQFSVVGEKVWSAGAPLVLSVANVLPLLRMKSLW